MCNYKGFDISVNKVNDSVKEHKYKATIVLSKGEHVFKYGETENDAIGHVKEYIDMSIRLNQQTK